MIRAAAPEKAKQLVDQTHKISFSQARVCGCGPHTMKLIAPN